MSGLDIDTFLNILRGWKHDNITRRFKKFCWAHNQQKSSTECIEKCSINNFPCHPELGSGSYRRQKFSTICTQKSNVGLKAQPTSTAFTLAGVFSPYYYSPRKVAFTLAEVLITLGIIGVVAAMTLPTLINNYQDKMTVTKLKRANSVLNQAFMLAVEKYGYINDWCDATTENGMLINTESCSKLVADRIAEFLPVVKRCKSNAGNANKPCFEIYYTGTNNQKTYFGGRTTLETSILTQDGIAYRFTADTNREHGSIWCNRTKKEAFRGNPSYYYFTCGYIDVDLNAASKPNKAGKDLFGFYIFKDGIIPKGTPEQNIWVDDFSLDCLGKNVDNLTGKTCTAWVLYNENLDYLKCPDKLSWSGQHNCKGK